MGIWTTGEVVPLPEFRYYYDYVVAAIAALQLLVFLGHTIQQFWIPAKTRLALLFRIMFAGITIDSILFSVHSFTRSHPFIHWAYYFVFGAIAVFVVICQMQILKSFTVMTRIITEQRITYAQYVILTWYSIGCALGLSFLPYLGYQAPIALITAHSIHFVLISVVLVMYETWNSVFISYLILRHSKRSETKQQSLINITNESFKTSLSKQVQRRYAIKLVLLLLFMLFFLWMFLLGFLYTLNEPAVIDPFRNAVRILVGHVILWYPIFIHYFFGVLKYVQFYKELDAADAKKGKDQKLIPLNGMEASLALSPTIVMND
jgi:hypothetical protein